MVNWDAEVLTQQKIAGVLCKCHHKITQTI